MYHSWFELVDTAAQRGVYRMVGSLVALEQRVGRSSEAHWAGKESGWKGYSLRAEGFAFCPTNTGSHFRLLRKTMAKPGLDFRRLDLVPV